jgi:hypothetical protein
MKPFSLYNLRLVIHERQSHILYSWKFVKHASTEEIARKDTLKINVIITLGNYAQYNE